MAYIGRDISNLSDRAVLDNITTSATATYNLLLNGVAYVPSSAESLTVSLNGVIQKPQSSYTVNNATIVFDSALTSSDSIDFILAERAITLTTVGSGSVGTSQLADGSVSNAKLDSTNQSFLKSIPQSGSAKTSSYTLTTSDLGSFIEVGSSGSITIPDATFNAGNAISLFNNTTGDITITCSITTAYISGTDADKSTVTLATRGIATILFISGTVCVISGNVS